MANNFSSDPDVVALYRFEAGALTTDSSGKGNTLTSSGSPESDTTNYKEGSAAVRLVYGDADRFHRDDVDLSSDFPLKNGTSNNVFSIVAWIRPTTINSSYTHCIAAKWDSYNGRRTFHFSVEGSSGKLRINLGYNNGSSSTAFLHNSVLITDTWYHVTLAYRNSDKTYALRVRDASGNVVGSDVEGTWDNNINIEDAPFTIGVFNYNGTYYSTSRFDGQLDELVVFKRFLAVSESTAIATGVYGQTATKTVADDGAGSDAISGISASLSVPDTASGADATGGMAAAVPVVETGRGADAISRILAAIAQTDQGQGADAISLILAALSIPETGFGSDTDPSVTAAVSVADQGQGSDAAPAIAVQVILSDTGAGDDAISILQALLKTVADAGQAHDSLGISVAVSVEDAGHGEDSREISVTLSITDAGAGADALSVLTALLKTITDAGSGSDAISGISASLSVPDTASGADSLIIAVSLTVPDAGSGEDSLAILQALLKTVADEAGGTDSLAGISVSVPVSDAGRGLDVISAITAILSMLDTAHGADALVVVCQETPTRVTVRFTGKKPGASFTGKKPGITFTGKMPGVDFES